jgi:cytidylate kinase
VRRAAVIAIDGPSGAGKGTVARALAHALGVPHLDTGAMYRAVAWKAVADRLPLDDGEAIASLARAARFGFDDGVSIDGRDVTRAIRTPEIDAVAAAVAKLPAVRQALVERQRALVGSRGIVMEGRDIGTVVLPDADVKIYLDAKPEERARRRSADPAHASAGAAVSDVATALEARDRSDRTRTASPLAVARDAVVIDTTAMAIDEVVRAALEIVRERLEGQRP